MARRDVGLKAEDLNIQAICGPSTARFRDRDLMRKVFVEPGFGWLAFSVCHSFPEIVHGLRPPYRAFNPPYPSAADTIYVGGEQFS